jgi:peptidoglycan hydrolase-like protein with peptidoglycan-binding domain
VKGRTNVTSPSDNVKKGDKGDGVKQIQTALKAAGYKVSVDGDFGNQTDAAVRQFQKKNNLTVDGVVGKVTWGKLQSAGGGTGSSATTTTTK